MFWIGEVVALVAGLTGIGMFRRWARSRWPWVSDYGLDWFLGGFLVFGLALTGYGNFQNEKQDAELKLDVEAATGFVYVATLNPIGISDQAGSTGIVVRTPLSKTMNGAWNIVEGRPRVNCDEESLEKFENAISLMTNFPFSYYAIAVCLRGQDNPEWRNYAESAVAIFENTTRIANHDKNHDEGLETLKKLLSD